MDILNLIPEYQKGIHNTNRESALVMLLAFIATYIITRGYTRIARIRGWSGNKINGIHTHHVVYGLIIAFLAGGLEFAFRPTPGLSQLILASAFGSGVALVLDEFALIFHLEDVYWEKEGRKSVDAVVLGVILGLLFLLNVMPFGTERGQGFWYIVVVLLVNVPIVVIAALKGKIFTAVFGVFTPVVSLIGSVRLAEPESLWARRFYKQGGGKQKRSQLRYKKYEKIWKVRKEKLWDIIGGKPGHPSQNGHEKKL